MLGYVKNCWALLGSVVAVIGSVVAVLGSVVGCVRKCGVLC